VTATVEAAVRFATDALVAVGSDAADARRVAESLVGADQAGLESHGLSRLPGYVRRVRAGGTSPGPWAPRSASGSIESYDGLGGLGHIHLDLATERAAALCAEHGIGVVGVANSNHAGALGPRARRLAERGMVGLLFTNAPAVLAPPGGREAVIGTNPIALAAPVPGRPPLVCDLSASQVSRGKIMLAAEQQTPIPSTWALDAAGRPTEDPQAALAGTLAPLGGTKGFVLALAVEVLTGVLLGPVTGPDVRDFFGQDLSEPQQVAHLVLALDPARFGAVSGFEARMLRLCGAIAEAGDPGETRLPGSRAAALAMERESRIPVGSGLQRSLADLAGELSIEPLRTDVDAVA
jgi:LDH2 family malate/lactate/ureidoglycolate dehydrogenase